MCKKCQQTQYNGAWIGSILTDGLSCFCTECTANYNAVEIDMCVELDNSNSKMYKQKNNIIKQNITSIKNLVTLPPNNKLQQLILSPSENDYKLWFKQMEKSKLSLTEQKNLLQNIVTSLSSFNNLHLDLKVKALLLRVLGPLKMLEVPDVVILETNNILLHNIIVNILLLGEYTSETNKYNYSEWFNLLYMYISLIMSGLRYNIPRVIYKEILQKYV